MINPGASSASFLKDFSLRYFATCGVFIMLAIGCTEQPDPSFSRLTMYQSLQHKEVVVVEIRKDEPRNNARTVRVSLGDDYSRWTQEIVTTTIRTGGENIASENIRSKWLTADTLSLCLSGNGDNQQSITVNVVERSHTIVPGSCPLDI